MLLHLRDLFPRRGTGSFPILQGTVRRSSTRLARGHTSHIGKTLILVLPSAVLNAKPAKPEITSPPGLTSVPLERCMYLAPTRNGVVVVSVDDARPTRAGGACGVSRGC